MSAHFRLYQLFIVYLHCQKRSAKGPKGTTDKMSLTKFILKLTFGETKFGTEIETLINTNK